MLTLTPEVDFDLDFVNALIRDGTNKYVLSGLVHTVLIFWKISLVL